MAGIKTIPVNCDTEYVHKTKLSRQVTGRFTTHLEEEAFDLLALDSSSEKPSSGESDPRPNLSSVLYLAPGGAGRDRRVGLTSSASTGLAGGSEAACRMRGERVRNKLSLYQFYYISTYLAATPSVKPHPQRSWSSNHPYLTKSKDSDVFLSMCNVILWGSISKDIYGRKILTPLIWISVDSFRV